MSVRQSPERVVDLVTAYIQQNIDTALANVRTDRSDAHVPLVTPKKYFISENYSPYQTPAIFVVCENIEKMKEEMGANHVNARADVNVSCVVEDTKEEVLTRQTFRYASALDTILDQAVLTSQNSGVKMVVVVKRVDFSKVYKKKTDTGGMSAAFRKEVLLSCEVRHFENF